VRLARRSLLAMAAVGGMVAFCAAMVGEMVWAQAKGPADFAYEGKGSGRVVFSHERHAVKNPKCTDCHTKIFKLAMRQRTAFKMADMERGQACGTCHNGGIAFGVREPAACSRCHLKA